jgi:glycosyltransferase involved in cell wall biosynthesis
MEDKASILLTVVVTVYDEINTIAESLRQVEALDIVKEIIVVDNCSTDGTREFLENYGNKDIQMVLRDRNRGYGQSIITACEMARGKYLYIHNSDLEYDPSYSIQKVELAEQTGCDAVFGSRLAKNTKGFLTTACERPYFLAALISTWMINLFYGKNFTDIIGSKFYRVSSLKTLFPFDDITLTFDFELVSKLCKRGYQVLEIPVSYKPRSSREGKKIKFFHSFPALWALLKVRLLD